MSGQAGGRGYLVQALTSVLDALTYDQVWTAIALDPNLTTDKVDILWQYPGRRKVVQVKSSQNQINVPDTKKWCEELEGSIQADEYELRLIGPVSEGVPLLGRHGKVEIPTPRPLDPDGLIHQAAHQLDRYLRARQFGVLPPATREMMVNALVTRLSTFATNGNALGREVFDGLLRTWISDIAPKTNDTPHAHTPQAAFETRPEEAVILIRLLDSRDKRLILWRADIGLMLLLDGQPIVDPRDAEVSQPYIEGFQRLERCGLLVNAPGEVRVYNLSSEGRVLAKRLRGKCPWCSEPMDNAEKDSKQPPIWECNKPQCLHSTWHRNKRCEVCGKRPAEIKRLGVGFASYRCEDGHSWNTKAGKD